jgi:hypothetical protein
MTRNRGDYVMCFSIAYNLGGYRLTFILSEFHRKRADVPQKLNLAGIITLLSAPVDSIWMVIHLPVDHR